MMSDTISIAKKITKNSATLTITFTIEMRSSLVTLPSAKSSPRLKPEDSTERISLKSKVCEKIVMVEPETFF